MEEIKVINQVIPSITLNFEDIKADLAKTLDEHRGLVVTEDTLPACKEVSKSLASLRVEVDTFRKDKKRELSAPITEFENKCKELIALIEEVEKPIKDGIAVFDNERRAEKRTKAEAIIKTIAEEMHLRPEYAERLTVIEKYCNLTAKPSEVESDVRNRAFLLLSEQQNTDEKLHILESVLESENNRLNKKLTLEDFKYQMGMGMDTASLIAEIKDRANMVYELENKEAPAPKAEPIAQVSNDAKTYAVELQVIGSRDELQAVSKFLKEHGISYMVLKQEAV